ncbi:MAG: TetR/AcrR family transcriptional regulator [Microbacteriaceae bacterium]|nr:TetR/AcrR family transcriptional regulator [Microbacteriaceae bacterium]
MQARSTARLASLLDAAATVVHEIGYERLTTAMVADGAGASIGTVYRYFPDRIAVLQSLAARNAERMTHRMLTELRAERNGDWDAALSAAFGEYSDGFNDERGFASLRYGDVLDLRPATEVPALTVLAGTLHDELVGRFGVSDSPAARAAFEAAVVAVDAITAHAYVLDPAGSPTHLDLARTTFRSLLNGHFR